MNNQREFFSIVNNVLINNKKEIASILKNMVKKELLSRNDGDKILLGSLNLQDLRQEELIWIYSELEKQGIVQSPVTNYFSKLEISNSKAIKEKMLSSDVIFRAIKLCRDIYNVEQKTKYIKDAFGSQETISIKEKVNFFSTVGVIENKYNCDVCNFTEEQLYDLFSSLNLLTINSFWSRRSVITLYYEWCYNQGLITENRKSLPDVIEFSKVDTSGKFKDKYFKDWNDLKGYVDVLISSLDVQEIDSLNTPIALLYLSWNGISIKDAVNIKIKDLDINNKRIQIGNNSVKIENDVMAEFLDMYSKSNEYEIHDMRNEIVTREYGNSVFLVRNVSSEKELSIETARGIIHGLCRVSNGLPNDNRYCEIKADYTNTSKSSLYSKLYEYEKTGGELTIDNLASLDFILQFGNTDRTKYNNIIKEYEKWRKYFYGN